MYLRCLPRANLSELQLDSVSATKPKSGLSNQHLGFDSLESALSEAVIVEHDVESARH